LANRRDKFQRLWERLIATLTIDQQSGDVLDVIQDKQHDWATEALNSPGFLAQSVIQRP